MQKPFDLSEKFVLTPLEEEAMRHCDDPAVLRKANCSWSVPMPCVNATGENLHDSSRYRSQYWAMTDSEFIAPKATMRDQILCGHNRGANPKHTFEQMTEKLSKWASFILRHQDSYVSCEQRAWPATIFQMFCASLDEKGKHRFVLDHLLYQTGNLLRAEDWDIKHDPLVVFMKIIIF